MRPLMKEEMKTDASWQFFYRPKDTWEAMYRDCANARHSIEFEQYILEHDAVGKRFMELFIQKARAGLKIFLICDKFGSNKLSRSPLVQELRDAGGHIHFYHTLKFWHFFTPWKWFPRTHVKTLLIDSEIAYTGGVCMVERMRDWRDTHMRLTGPITRQVRSVFDTLERKLQTHWPRRTPRFTVEGNFQYLLSRPLRRRCTVYSEIIKSIANAQDYIYIASAYFIPNRRFVHQLRLASRRGVDIRILVPEHSDVPLADWIRLSYTPRFLKAGMRIFHYRENVLHSKIAMIDDKWATVGSTNFDVISFFHNREGNVVITETEAIRELKSQFNNDMGHSAELTWDAWRLVPWWKKAAGWMARSIKVFFG